MLEQQGLASECCFDLIGIFYADLSDWQIYFFFLMPRLMVLSSGAYSLLCLKSASYNSEFSFNTCTL